MYMYDNNISKGTQYNCSCSCTDFNYKNVNKSKCRERIVQQPSNSPSNTIILGTN